MAQPPTIYKPGKLNYLWNYLSYNMNELKVRLQGYRSYKAMLFQDSTTPPVAVVLENTLGIQLEYIYGDPGEYIGIINTNLFISPTETLNGKKVEVKMTPSVSNINIELFAFTAFPIYDNVILITSWDTGNIIYADSILGNFCSNVLEIKVYN